MAIFGSQPYAPGTPRVTLNTRGVPNRNPYTGAQNGSRKIDPATRDFVIDPATGQSLGMTNAQQLVYMAFKTDLGSSAMREIGQKLAKIKRIGPSFALEVDVELRRVVQHIVDQKVIEVVGTSVQIVRPGAARASLRFRDVETQGELGIDVEINR